MFDAVPLHAGWLPVVYVKHLIGAYHMLGVADIQTADAHAAHAAAACQCRLLCTPVACVDSRFHGLEAGGMIAANVMSGPAGFGRLGGLGPGRGAVGPGRGGLGIGGRSNLVTIGASVAEKKNAEVGSCPMMKNAVCMQLAQGAHGNV